MCQAARMCQNNNGLVASVSSLLISLVVKPLAKNAILTGRSVLALLARDAGDDQSSAADAPRGQHCQQCAGSNDGARLSGSDAAAVMASLGLVPRRGRGDDEEEDDGMAACGGCEAMEVVEEVAWGSKEAGEAELREAFGVFDRDGDGVVSAGELWAVLRRLGMPEGARYEDCARMVAAAAARHGDDADGGLGFPEFRAMMEHAA